MLHSKWILHFLKLRVAVTTVTRSRLTKIANFHPLFSSVSVEECKSHKFFPEDQELKKDKKTDIQVVGNELICAVNESTDAAKKITSTWQTATSLRPFCCFPISQEKSHGKQFIYTIIKFFLKFQVKYAYRRQELLSRDLHISLCREVKKSSYCCNSKYKYLFMYIQHYIRDNRVGHRQHPVMSPYAWLLSAIWEQK